MQSLVRWPSATKAIPEGAAFPADGAASPLLKGNLTEHLSPQHTCLFFLKLIFNHLLVKLGDLPFLFLNN